MKIAVVSNMYPDEKHPSYGVFVKNFCNILDDINVDYKLYVMLKADSSFEKLLRYIKFYIGTTIALLFEKYDLIYVHYASHSSLPVLWMNKFRKKKIYTNVHGSDVVPENKRQEKMQKYTRKILSISEKIIVPSEYFKNLVSQKYGISKELIYVSPSGGVNSKVFYREGKKEHKEFLRMGYVGRISHKKGWDTLLKACAKLTIPYELVVVGNGGEYKEMQELAKELNVDKKIRWYDLQPQKELRKLYNEMDVFVFPTEREGESLGLVGLEAMACGTPVISSNQAAPADYVNDGLNGYQFDSGNPEDLASVIKNFANLSPEKLAQLENCAIQTAQSYSIDKTSETIKAIIFLGGYR